MRSWSAPEVPTLPVTGPVVRIHDTATGGPVTAAPDGPARLYVCGITPYDATHLGHAATYIGFDLLYRAWRSSGLEVVYVQNVTDVDDPLLERAAKVHVDWVELAERETELFRTDMEALRVLPPDHYTGAVESIPLVIEMIERLQAAGATYVVERDLYFSAAADPAFGQESGYDRETMLRYSAERGGDPGREARRTRSTWSSGSVSARASPRGTARSGLGDPAGTSSAPRSPRRTSAPASTCRPEAATWSSRTTR